MDGLTYTWMGNYNTQNGTANVTNIQVTPTRSIFTMQAGPMNVTVTFLSPIEVCRTTSRQQHAWIADARNDSHQTGSISLRLSRICP